MTLKLKQLTANQPVSKVCVTNADERSHHSVPSLGIEVQARRTETEKKKKEISKLVCLFYKNIKNKKLLSSQSKKKGNVSNHTHFEIHLKKGGY